jgi:sugar phosphate isomerase/epimerase
MAGLFLAPTTLPDAPPLAFIEAAGAAGFDGIGLRLNASPGLPFHPVASDPALTRDVERRIADLGLEVLDVLSFYLQPATDVAKFAAPLELGAALGARYALVIGDDPDWDRMRGNLARFCDLAAPLGIAASIEFVPRRRLRSLPQVLQLIREAGRGNAALCVDPLHLVRSGAAAADLKRLDPRLIPYVQLCDGLLEPGEPDPDGLGRAAPERRCMPGDGVLPLRDILAAVPAGIPVSVEVPKEDDAIPAPDWAKAVLRRGRDFLARLGRP